MHGDVIKELDERLARPQTIGGVIAHPTTWALTDPASLVKPGPQAKTLVCATLGAVRDYLKANRDALDLSTLLVHVESPSSVSVLSTLDTRAAVRHTFVAAKCEDASVSFLGKYHSLEDFIIGLQVRFDDAEDRKRVLSLLSNVKSEQVKSALDDGMTQVVQARAGVALVSDVAVPNPVNLAPFRTFRDVLQPASLFVLRLQRGAELPQAGLFEADGGAWRLTAIGRVRDWLAAELPPAVAVIG